MPEAKVGFGCANRSRRRTIVGVVVALAVFSLLLATLLRYRPLPTLEQQWSVYLDGVRYVNVSVIDLFNGRVWVATDEDLFYLPFSSAQPNGACWRVPFPDRVHSMTMAGETLVCGGTHGRIWGVTRGECRLLAICSGPAQLEVNSVDCDQSGRALAVCTRGANHVAVMTRQNDGFVEVGRHECEERVNKVRVAPDGRCICAVTRSGRVLVGDGANWRPAAIDGAVITGMKDVVFVGNDTVIACGMHGAIYVIGPQSISKAVIGASCCIRLACRGIGIVAVVHNDNELVILDAGTGAIRGRVEAYAERFVSNLWIVSESELITFSGGTDFRDRPVEGILSRWRLNLPAR
ncbi:MAG: hypothetical protein K1X57_15115 [Gemmataceae bacterium]|nr:hypothetical protein [Gemmataceae bacterium]